MGVESKWGRKNRVGGDGDQQECRHDAKVGGVTPIVCLMKKGDPMVSPKGVITSLFICTASHHLFLGLTKPPTTCSELLLLGRYLVEHTLICCCYCCFTHHFYTLVVL